MNLKDLYINFIKENKTQFIFYVLTLLYIPINRIYLPKLYGNLITNLKDKKFGIVQKTFIMLIIAWFVIQIINTASSYIMYSLMPKFKQSIRKFLVTEIMDRYKTNYQELKLGEIITKIIKTPYVLEDIFYMFKDFVVKNIITIISIFGYLTYYNFKLGLVFGGFMILLILVTVYYISQCKDNISKMENLYDLTHEEIEDTFSNLLSIYTARKYENEKDRITKIDDRLFKNIKSLNKCQNKYRIIYCLIFMVIIIYLNYYGYRLYRKKEMKLDTFVSVFIINYSLLGIFMGLFHEINDYMHVSVNINLLLDYLENKLPQKENPLNNKNNIPQLNYNNSNNNSKNMLNNGLDIKVQNVSFRYKKSLPYVLKNVNLHIKPNETIIIKGSIGSGKSTLSKLILKLLVNYEGEILINGLSNKNMDIEDLREKIVYIPQHPNLFNRTLEENLMYSVDPTKISIQQILNKLDEVDLTDIKNTFIKMLKIKVGKLGHTLSGGQRQIVWILRSIFSKSKMVILDEPTSSLDEESKEKIMKLIQIISKNRNLIIITHDKDLVNYNIHNRIIIFDKGKIDKIIKNNK